MAATWYLRQGGIYAKHVAIAWGILSAGMALALTQKLTGIRRPALM
ncbi:MAG: hypothetical protein ACX93T_00920 [Bacteroidota bacterium]